MPEILSGIGDSRPGVVTTADSDTNCDGTGGSYSISLGKVIYPANFMSKENTLGSDLNGFVRFFIRGSCPKDAAGTRGHFCSHVVTRDFVRFAQDLQPVPHLTVGNHRLRRDRLRIIFYSDAPLIFILPHPFDTAI